LGRGREYSSEFLRLSSGALSEFSNQVLLNEGGE
jgi:hypothetical protein